MFNLPPSVSNLLKGHNSWFDKLTSAQILGHPLVWSAFTALFILIGYLWLQNYALPLSEGLEKQQADINLIGENIINNRDLDTYNQIDNKDQLSITHQGDDQRAQNFRVIIELENQVNPILKLAREQMEQLNYISKTQQSAWLSYQNILDIDSEHKLAISGQDQILSILKDNAQTAVDERQYKNAEVWLEKLDIILPSYLFQADLREIIATEIELARLAKQASDRKTQRLQQLTFALEGAQTAMLENPKNLELAFDLFNQTLQIDDANEEALSGLVQINLDRTELAKLAIARSEYQTASDHIARLVEANIEAEIIKGLKQALTLAKVRDIKSNQNSPARAAAEPTTNQIIPTANQAQNTAIVNDSNEVIIKTIPVEVITSTNIDIITDNLPTTLVADVNPLPISSAIDAYFTGDYKRAFESLLPLAEENDARAQFRLGMMYYHGKFVIKNTDLANQWITRALPSVFNASINDEPWAQAALGTAYELGLGSGFEKDTKRAAELYKKAANRGDVGAQTNLGILYGIGDGVKYDRQLAIFWFKQAAAQGNKTAQESLSILNVQ